MHIGLVMGCAAFAIGCAAVYLVFGASEPPGANTFTYFAPPAIAAEVANVIEDPRGWSLAGAHGIASGPDRATIIFEVRSIGAGRAPEDTVSGMHTQDGKHYIVIRLESLGMLRDTGQLSKAINHELGHALFDLPHDAASGGVMDGVANWPAAKELELARTGRAYVSAGNATLSLMER